MRETEKKIDALLKVLNDYSSASIENVQKLADDVELLKTKVYSDTKETYEEIKKSLFELKKHVKETEITIDNLDKDKYIEGTNIKISYYSSLVNIKNEIMNYNVNNIDDVFSAFDEFENSRYGILSRISEAFKDTYKITNKSNYELIKLMINSLDDEVRIYRKYQSELHEALKTIKDSIYNITTIYISMYDSYMKEVKIAKERYEKKNSELTRDFYELDELMNDFPNAVDKNEALLKEREERIKEKYEAKLEKNFEEFKKISSRDIKHLETALKGELKVKDLKSSRKEILDELRADLSRINDKEYVLRLERAMNDEEMDDAITHGYKKLNNDNYEAFKEKEREIEKEYFLELRKKRSKHLKTRYISKVDDMDSILNNYLDEIEKLDLIDYNYILYINKRYELTSKFEESKIKFIEALRKIELSFNYDTDLILESLKKDIYTSNNKLEFEVAKTKENLILSTSSYDAFYSSLYKEELRNIALLDYEIKLSRLHRNYINVKGVLYIASALFSKSRELDLLEPRYELIKILHEYDVSRSSLENAYKSEVDMLKRTKEREEITLMGDYKFAESFLTHRINSLCELIDMTNEEYNVRIAVLNEIKEDNNEYQRNRIDKLIGDYLDQQKELQDIKELNLNSLAQKMKYLSNGSDEDKIKNLDRLNEILTEYEAASKRIEYLIKNNPEIIDHKENIDAFNELVVDAIDRNQFIKEEATLEAVRYLSTIEDEFDALIKSIVNYKVTDYKTAFNEYKLSYLIELNRINENLDRLSTPKIEELNKIAEYYKNDFYMVEYNKLNEEHKRLTNEYYKDLLNRYSEINEEPDLFPSNGELNNQLYKEKIELFEDEKNAKDSAIQELFDKNVNFIKTKYENDTNSCDIRVKVLTQEKKKKDKVEKETLENSLREYHNVAKEGRQKLKSIASGLNKRYSFESYAFKHDLDDKLKTIEKEVNDKYKNPTVYEMRGDKKD